MLRAALLLTLSAAFTGCALSPQSITVQPAAKVQTTNIGQNQPVMVLAVDSRDQLAFGTRGGVYKETSLVQPANDVKTAIEEAVRQGLQKQGFNAFNPGTDATSLEVRLEQLDYVPEQGSVVNSVTISLVLVGEASRPDVGYTGTYKSSIKHDLPITPSANRNQEMINEILSAAITRMLEDPKMQNFLLGNDPA
ncbi:YajG family lipoprotein [Alcanivorax sp. S6407]|uniref:YajG family lipoprotein n=1 Tax=Alcanivorax sp. S6407 TaxID=2926424 RepID=UPI001FF631CA|nr:YajG family lipoprotein [Alcanivorax sp. S6407]MCK0155235.1 YajG family lipoprotein [Alcanivorax sp. S6407]